VRLLPCIALALAAGLMQAQAQTPARFSFAIVGDAPYNTFEEAVFAQMLRETGAEDLAFVVHVGDIKSGSSLCSDELYAQRKRMFDASRRPFILVPGDNEWTDCWRKSAGGYDPLERLDRLRQIFFDTADSLGQQTLKLDRQSDDPASASAFRAYRENVRWVVNGVLFIGLNIPGGNDNYGRTLAMDAEHARRGLANAAWLAQGFELAKKNGYAAVFICIQADPNFDSSYLRRAIRADGYAAFKQQLLAHTLAFGKPVVLVHGDTHRFRVDRPLVDPATLKRVEQFTRIESFGSPLVDWISVTFYPAKPVPISVRTGKPSDPATQY
jgi:hypothetical protein